MSNLFDDLKGKAEDLKDKAAALVDQHGDKISDGIEKTASFADDKTGGKYTDKIDTGAAKAKEALDSLDGSKDDFAADEPPAAPPA